MRSLFLISDAKTVDFHGTPNGIVAWTRVWRGLKQTFNAWTADVEFVEFIGAGESASCDDNDGRPEYLVFMARIARDG